MLTYDLDKRGNKTMYEYLYELIKEDIADGKLKADEKPAIKARAFTAFADKCQDGGERI